MIPKIFDVIEKTDVEALVENKVGEGRTIEYKASLPGGSEGEKKEFLADVSSFANAGGGDLIYGVIATDGIPKEIMGIAGNMDAILLHYENLLRDGLEPRIPGIRMKPISGFANGPVLLIRTPRSWAAPHMIKLGKSNRFFTRNSAGKHQMDVTEIRAAFLLSDALPERMRRFRDERLGRVIANETPVRMFERAKLVLHILPVASFTMDAGIEVAILKEHSRHGLQPIGCSGYSHGINLDGFFTYDKSPDDTGGTKADSLFDISQGSNRGCFC